MIRGQRFSVIRFWHPLRNLVTKNGTGRPWPSSYNMPCQSSLDHNLHELEPKMAANVQGKMKLLSKANGLLSRLVKPSLQVRTFSEAMKEYDMHDISTGSEMPLMFPPQVIKKGFGVHQSPRVFALNPHEKMIWLTKTYLTTGMPDELKDVERNSQAVELIRDYFHQIFAFQRSVPKTSRTFHEEELSLGLLQQMLQVAFMTGPPKNQDLFVHRKPFIESNWFRNFTFFNAKYQPSLVIRTSEQLQPLKSTFPLPLGLFSHFLLIIRCKTFSAL